MNTSEVIGKAADLLRDVGWQTGRLKDMHGYCLLGAVYEASGILAETERQLAQDRDTPYQYPNPPAVDYVYQAIAESDPHWGGWKGGSHGRVDQVWLWNDSVANADSAIHMLKRAQELALEAEV